MHVKFVSHLAGNTYNYRVSEEGAEENILI
jgi:hypothetical protein